MTPQARSLAWLRDQGFAADTAERKITRTLTRDLFGCIDIVAMKDSGVHWIQVTDGSNASKRVHKVRASEHYDLLCATGNVYVHAWRRNAKGVFVLRVIDCKA